MSQFDNPSAAAPFRAGFLLLIGMGNGKDGRNGLELRYGAVTDPKTMPDFQPLSFVEIAGGSTEPTSIVTPNGVYDGAIPFLFALDATTIVAIYPGCENGQDGIWAHIFSDTGATLVRVGAYQLLYKYLSPYPAQIGASLIPGKAGVLVAPPNITNMIWCTVPAVTPQAPATWTVQFAPMADGPQAQQDSASVLGAAINRGMTDTSIIVVPNSAGVGDPPAFAVGYCAFWRASELTVAPFQVVFPDPAGPPTLSWGAWVKSVVATPLFFFSSPDGFAWYQLAGSSLTIGKVNADGTLGGGAVFGDHLSGPAVVYHTFAPFTPDPQPGSDPEVVGVFRSLLNGLGEPLIVQIGNARRTVFTQEPAPDQQGVIIGIFESGPPIPNENAAAVPASTVGTTTFGELSSKQTGWTIGASIGGFLQYSSSNGIPDVATLDTSFNIAFGVNTAFSQSTTQMDLDTKQAVSSVINNPGFVKPVGAALVALFEYVGSKFEFLDNNSNPVPGAAIFYQMAVSGMTVQEMPFEYPSSGYDGPYPGRLLSYPTLDAVQNTYQTGTLNGTPAATCSWSTAGSTTGAPTVIVAGSKSIGAYLNFNASIGAKVGPPGESVSVSAGVSANFNFNYQWADTEQDQFSTSVALPALDDPPPQGAYAGYGYYAFLLEHDNSYTEDLIALLKANPTEVNTTLLNAISPQSVPWKIAYAISGTDPADPTAAGPA